MKKSDEIANPNSCLNRARNDEPIFVFRANDPCAPNLVRAWAHRYLDNKMSIGPVTQAHVDKANEALNLAEQMEIWSATKHGLKL